MFDSLQKKISSLCQKCGRDPDGITLIGASKKQGIATIRREIGEGLHHLGENYAQELLEKKAVFDRNPSPSPPAQTIVWHFIGRIQHRKLKKLIAHVDYFHSLARRTIAATMNQEALACRKTVRALIQINLSNEDSKEGIHPEELKGFLADMNSHRALQIVGLMCLPPFHENLDEVRPFFTRLRQLRDEMNNQAVYKDSLSELSMGMSHDFSVAIEEGATMVRIGTALFGERI
jgi:PLP dependent protein